MVLTRAQRKRLLEARVSPYLELLVGVAANSTPPKTPLPTPEKEVPAPEVTPVPKREGALDYLRDAGVDLGGCDDFLTIKVVEVGNTNYYVKVPHSDQGNAKPKDPWGLDVHGAPGDDYYSDGLDEFFGGQIDYTYYPPPPEVGIYYDGASSIDEGASDSTNGWGNNEDVPIYIEDSDTSDSEDFHRHCSHF